MFAASKSGSADAKDPQFNYVTMLLHGNGTNGAQNNTFTDSSTNNFTITRNGNTTQGTFSPYGSNWSNYFDGSSYETVAGSTNLAFGTDDFTIECWVNFNSVSSGNLLDMRPSSTNGAYPNLYVSSGTLAYYVSSSDRITGGTVTVGTWYHIALCRSGTSTKLFLNGTQIGSTYTDSNNYVCGTNRPMIAGNGFSNSANFNAYVSNFRFIKGTALYTTSFTPPTTPLTAITNTSLLICQSNRFIDNSASPYTITISGSPSVQRFSPFKATSAYSTSVIGGSGYFDGSGDYLSVADNTAFNLSGGDYTLEAWIYWNGNTADYRAIIAKRISGTGTTAWEIFLNITTGTFCFFDGTIRNSGVTPPPNAWSHVAACWNNSTSQINLYLNGTRVLQTSATNTNRSADVVIGTIYASAGIEQYIGYMTDVRVVKGTQVYTGTTYTVPTAPLTAISGTSLLLSTINAGILDNAMMNDLETVGNAQISTSVKKYGTGSMYFDGNGDNLSSPTTPNLNMSTGNWTIECWVYILSRTLNYPLIFGNNNGSYTTGALALVNSNADSASYNDRFCLSVKDHLNAPTLVASSTNSSNTWYHLAVVRNGTSLVMYRDGTSVASATISSGLGFDWGKLGSRIGGGNWDGAQSYFNGYIDDLRITKGVARYTSNFTAPTAPFPDKG